MHTLLLCGKHVPSSNTAYVSKGKVYIALIFSISFFFFFPPPDLALRCLVESYATCCNEENQEPVPKRTKNKAEGSSNSSNDDDNERNKEVVKPVAGIVIALCCHHKCDWTHYVGREFFRSVGLGPVEFHYFQRMSSWATCGMRGTITKASTNEESEDHANNAEELDQTYSKTETSSDALQRYMFVC